MILAIGIDCIEIERFAQWHLYSDAQLSRIFCPQEIAYCKENPTLAAQRFAVRFAAREALYKALAQAMPGHSVPFLTLCRNVIIQKDTQNVPFLALKNTLGPKKAKYLLSLTHSKTMATAFVVIEKA